jgi:hypothetical protein
MAEYQAERGVRVRAEREQALRDGTAETFGSLFRRRPVLWCWCCWRWRRGGAGAAAVHAVAG